jgi:hypothetical protein
MSGSLKTSFALTDGYIQDAINSAVNNSIEDTAFIVRSE